MLSVFLYKNRKVLTFILLLVLSFVMMASGSTQVTFSVKSVFLTIIYPFEYVINGVFGFIKSTWKSIGQLEAMRNELIQTRKRLQKYEAAHGDMEKLRYDNKRLRKLLQQKDAVKFDHILAGVISKDPQNLYQSIVINRGSSDGVKRDMPVAAYRNGMLCVVGRVVETTAVAARVVTIREPRFYIGAQLAKSRYYGLVQGRGVSKSCNLKYVDINAPVKHLEQVYTSGHSDIFPKGLLIGRVVYIHRETGSFFLDLRIVPAVDFAKLEDLYVIKKQPSAAIRKLIKAGEMQ